MKRILLTTVAALALFSEASTIALAQVTPYTIPSVPGSTFQPTTPSFSSPGFNAPSGGSPGLSTLPGATGAANGGINGGYAGTVGGMPGASGVIGGTDPGLLLGYGSHRRG